MRWISSHTKPLYLLLFGLIAFFVFDKVRYHEQNKSDILYRTKTVGDYFDLNEYGRDWFWEEVGRYSHWISPIKHSRPDLYSEYKTRLDASINAHKDENKTRINRLAWAIDEDIYKRLSDDEYSSALKSAAGISE